MDFEQLIATLNNSVIVASAIVIAIRNWIHCAALSARPLFGHFLPDNLSHCIK